MRFQASKRVRVTTVTEVNPWKTVFSGFWGLTLGFLTPREVSVLRQVCKYLSSVRAAWTTDQGWLISFDRREYISMCDHMYMREIELDFTGFHDLDAFTNIKKLKLDLMDEDTIGPHEIANALLLLKSLTSLDLACYANGQVINAISTLTKLQSLDFQSEGTMDTKEFINLLQQLEELLRLGLHEWDIDPAILEHLPPALKSLTLTGDMTNNHVAPLQRLRELKELNVRESNLVTSECLQFVPESTTSLSLAGCSITTLRGLKCKPESLDLRDCPLELGALDTINVSNLTSLQLESNPFTVEDLPKFFRATRMEELSVYKCSLFDKDPELLFESMPHLRKLDLNDTPITPAFYTRENLWKLTDLALVQCDGVNQGASVLAHLPDLKRLNLNLTDVADASLVVLAESSSLTELHINMCGQITDGGIEALARKANIKQVVALSSANATRETAHLFEERGALLVTL